MLTRLKERFGGLAASVIRFPATVALLAATAVLTSVAIGTETDLTRWILSTAVGTLACAVAQVVYERFLYGGGWRLVLILFGLALGALFCISIQTADTGHAEQTIRSAVAIFALYIAFVWVGVIKSRYSFDESFTAAFKALFQAAFFSGVLFLGCAAIVAAMNLLIVRIAADAYAYAAAIVFEFVAPVILLSLIPVYPGRAALQSDEGFDRQRALIEKRTGCPKFLEILLSYIVLPLVAVFTVILVAYILLNIGGRFWTNNLLEPLLISYTAAVITAALLVGRLENRIAVLFLKIFPKVLIPIALFQVVASSLVLGDTGVTYGRYYVILYGVFAALSGIVLSIPPLQGSSRVRRSGVIALMLIVLSAVSLLPPVDAFSVSRNSQISTLEKTLLLNGMLQDGAVKPNGKIPDRDKTKIASAVRYLSETSDLDKVAWLPAGFNGYDDTAFYNTFGFHLYQQAQPPYASVFVSYDPAGLIPIAGYDAFARIGIPDSEKPESVNAALIKIGARTFSLTIEGQDGAYTLAVTDDTDVSPITYDLSQIFSRYASYDASKGILTQDEATFTAENENAALKLVVLNAGFNKSADTPNQHAQMLVFLQLKDK